MINNTREPEDESEEEMVEDAEMNEEEEDDDDMEDTEDDDDDDSDSDSDDSLLDSAMDDEAARLMSFLAPTEQQQPPEPSPEEQWQTMVETLAQRGGSLKVTDVLVAFMVIATDEDDDIERRTVETAVTQLVDAIHRAPPLHHVILGRVFLQLVARHLSPSMQAQLFWTIVTCHSATCSFWKLGSDDSVQACEGLDATLLFQTMLQPDVAWNVLTEVEIRGLQLSQTTQLNLIQQFLQHKCHATIRQWNMLGLTLSATLLSMPGVLDALVGTVQTLPAAFDELQLSVSRSNQDSQPPSTPPPPLLSTTALQNLLMTKPKWWRLALDGLALQDAHVQILARALQASDVCKMNDVLSVRANPAITVQGLETLYRVCLNKQRMGLVLSDDAHWVATMDLVRPLNNLHSRLEYRVKIQMENKNGSASGSDNNNHTNNHHACSYYAYKSRNDWIAWLAVLANLPWIEDARKVNYLWFTLLEQPGLVKRTEG